MTTTASPFPAFGPGSQEAEPDGAQFDYMEMPQGMSTYHMPLVPEADEVEGVEEALALFEEIREALETFRQSAPSRVFDLTHFDANNRAFVNQLLGEGEVSAVGGATIQVQESVLTGVWRLYVTDQEGAMQRDLIEIAAFPDSLLQLAQRDAALQAPANLNPLPEGVANAPALLTELADATASFTADAPPHVINLSLLPLTEEDVLYLAERTGPGPVTVLSRGYGNCRITSTGVRNVWWVQYFNSNEAMILNTLEVTGVPEVACAAEEDIADSAQRLGEILGVYR